MPKKNAYFFYMLDYIKEAKETTGRTLSVAQASSEASASWQSLTETEKAYYKEKVNSSGDSGRGGSMWNGGSVRSGGSARGSGVRTSQGILVSDIERALQEQRSSVDKMKKRIRRMLEHSPVMSDFESIPLYFMYGNYFYRNNSGVFAPAEIAVVRFTFNHGILQRFHSFIAPEKVESGYAWTARDRSARIHRLPCPPEAMGERDFGKIYKDVINFIRDKSMPKFDDGKPIVFTHFDFDDEDDEQFRVLNSFMDQFSGGANDIAIYPVNHLFHAIIKELAAKDRCDDIPHDNYVKTLLSYDPYEATGKICCKYHDDLDASQHCALGRATRLTYILSDHLCAPLGVNLVAGKHLPVNVAKSVSSTKNTARTYSMETLNTEAQVEECSSRLSQCSFKAFSSASSENE